MKADNKYLFIFVFTSIYINKVAHICYSIFIHKLLLLPRIQVIDRCCSTLLWQSRTENYQEI